MEEIPEFITRLDTNKKQDVSWDETKKMMVLNTRVYWWAYFDTKTEKLYDQFANLIMDNAKDYLIKEGHIDKDMNKIKEFISEYYGV